jgi:hypothetical protein
LAPGGGAAGAGGAVIFTRPDHRDAPHVFGAGLKEMLADEMTAELRARRARTIHQAQQSGQAVTVTLQSKGATYGRLTALPDGSVDSSKVAGVDPDFPQRGHGSIQLGVLFHNPSEPE